MAFNVYVENERGESIVSFGEGSSREVVTSLWEIERKTGIMPKYGGCHLEEIYRLNRDIAIPLLVENLEKLLLFLKGFLKYPEGHFDYQKCLFYQYEKDLRSLENFSNETFIFRVWDTS